MNGFKEGDYGFLIYCQMTKGPRFGIAEALASVPSIIPGLSAAKSEEQDLGSVKSRRVKRQQYNSVGECTGVAVEQTWVLMPNLLLTRQVKVSYLEAVSPSFLICEMKII